MAATSSSRSRSATSPRGIRRLAWTIVGSTLLLIAMGGAVRATDSGLACPDWPACHGMWIPPADMHMWFEHSHRLWAGVVALMIVWLAGWTFMSRRRSPASWWLSLTTLVLVLFQAGLGAAVVLLHLRASLVTTHLVTSFVILALLTWVAMLGRTPSSTDGSPTERRIGKWAAVVAAVVLAQSALGGQATGRGAAYVFNAFPIWLSDDAWTGHARELLHVTHRVGGYVVASVVVSFAVWISRTTDVRWARRLTSLAVLLVAVQVGLGITNVLTQATVVSAIGHLTVASWLWAVVVAVAIRGLTLPRRDAREAQPSPIERAAQEVPA